MRVAVARNKFVKGIEPGREVAEAAYRVCELREALEHVYFTDAHLVTYLVEGLDRQPRVNKPGLELYGKRLTVECLFCDVDNPEHQRWTPETFEAARQVDLNLPILATAGIYYTSRGRRIVQPLAAPLDVTVVESHLQHWLNRLQEAGVPVDQSCKDWTRHFRLPHVKRDGISERSRCLDLTRMQPTALPPLPVIELEAVEPRQKASSSRSRGAREPPEPRSPTPLPEYWRPVVVPVAAAIARVNTQWHALFLALAGALLKLGVPPEHVPALNEAIALATHADDRVQDRVNCAYTTLKRWRAGEAFAALRALQENWPEVARTLEATVGALRFAKVPVAEPKAAPVETRTLEEITAALEATIENAPPGLTLIKAECGLGKTQAALRVAARRAAKPYASSKAVGLRAPANSKTVISVDKNKLAIQCTDELSRQGHSSLRLFGPLSLRDPNDNPVCQFRKVGEPLVAGGQRLQWELCERRNGDTKCPHYDNCPAREGQQGDRKSRITVGSHALLGALDGQAGSTGLLVIDEVQDFLETVELSEDDLERAIQSAPISFDGMFVAALAPVLWAWLGFLQESPESQTVEACEAVRRVERKVPSGVLQQAQRSALVTSDADAVECALAAPFPRGHQGHAPPILKMAVDFALFDSKKAEQLGRISKVLKTAHHAISSDYPVVVRVESRREHRRLLVTSPREMLARALRRDGAVVVTDANAELHLPILAKVVGYEPPLHVFTAPDGAPIARTMIRTRKATRKAWFKKGQLALDSPLVPLIEAAIAWARETPDTRALGIITVPLVEVLLKYAAGHEPDKCRHAWKSMGQPKDALEALSARVAPSLAIWSGTLLTAHYGATRGLNDMAEADALVTLGDPWANLGDAKSDAAFLQLEAVWEQRYEARCRAELEQAHGRLRTVHRKRPGRALHVGAVMPGGSGWTNGKVEVRDWPASVAVGPTTASAEDFARAVRALGGLRAAATMLGCSKASVGNYATGKRAVPRDVAERVRQSSSGT